MRSTDAGADVRDRARRAVDDDPDRVRQSADRALTFASLIGYAIVYTAWLKRATPQNIVIGGIAGAAPPVLGWAAVTGSVHPYALLLFLIIFVWTPPHFWALAIFRRDDYSRAQVPMLPVTHGVVYTRWHVLFYTILLVVVTALPYLTGMSGLFYFGGALVLGRGFLYYAIRLAESARRMFRDARVQLLDRLSDGAVRVPAGRSLSGAGTDACRPEWSTADR